MRRPVIYCPKLAIDWISSVVISRGYKIKINEFYKNDYVSIKINESLI